MEELPKTMDPQQRHSQGEMGRERRAAVSETACRHSPSTWGAHLQCNIESPRLQQQEAGACASVMSSAGPGQMRHQLDPPYL